MAISSGDPTSAEQAADLGVEAVLIKPSVESDVFNQKWLEAVSEKIGLAIPNFTVRSEWIKERSQRLLRQAGRLTSSEGPKLIGGKSARFIPEPQSATPYAQPPGALFTGP